MVAREKTQPYPRHLLPDIAHLGGVVLLGLVFPEVGSLLCAMRSGDITLSAIFAVQASDPVLWLLDMVPIALVAAAEAKGSRSGDPIPVSGIERSKS